MKVSKLPATRNPRRSWLSREGTDPYGNKEFYFATPWFGIVINAEDVCDPDTHWWFLGIFDRDDPADPTLMAVPYMGHPVAVYCKGWGKQVELEPTDEEMQQHMHRGFILHDDDPRLVGVVVQDISVV